MADEKKKCDKAKKSGSIYRTFKAKQLRHKANLLTAEAKTVILAAEKAARKRGLTKAQKNAILSHAESVAGRLTNRANDLNAKAARIASGYKRPHKPDRLNGPVARIQAAIQRERGGWDILSEKGLDKRPAFIATVKICTVSNEPERIGMPLRTPIVGVAWNERVKGTPEKAGYIPDAPKTGLYQIVNAA